MKTPLNLFAHVLIVFISFGSTPINAQGTEFWGLTTDNSDPGVGTIFKTDSNGNHLSTAYRWHINEGIAPSPELCKASNGKFYGITSGSTKGYGSIFEYDPATDIYTTKFFFFDEVNGRGPMGSLMQAGNGKLYGMTYSGGENNNGEGVLFEWDPVTNIYEKKYDLKSKENGRHFQGTLLQADNGKLYGMTTSGGVLGLGVLFEYDPVNNIYCKKVDFDGEKGASPEASLIQADNGKLYGMTKSGGAEGQNYSCGVLFEWDISTDTYTKKWDFNNAENGSCPSGSLVKANNGKLYGMTSSGGTFSKGVIFEWDPVTDIYAKKFEFNDVINGQNPSGSLMIAEDGKFYGMTSYGGEFHRGVIFEWDTLTNSVIKKMEFNEDSNGKCIRLIQADSNRFFGTMSMGGSSDKGELFEWNTTTNIYTRKYDFNGAENGSLPSGSFMQATNGKLYGVTQSGGIHGKGVLFEWDPVNQKLSRKIDFMDYDGINYSVDIGYYPIGTLMQATNNKIYGFLHGVDPNESAIFEWDPVTNEYTRKFNFPRGSNDYNPCGSLIQANNGKLYGLTSGGYLEVTLGTYGGTIYEWDPAADIFTSKFNFFVLGYCPWPRGCPPVDLSNGGNPNGSLVLTESGKFYGVTRRGKGTLFEWDPATNIFLKRIDFNGAENGQKPDGSLLLAHNGKLYGVTSEGGEYNKGTLFEWDPATDSLVKKIDFNDGADPSGTLMQARNGKIYGVTKSGGANDGGILYEWDPVSEIYTKKFDFKSGESGTGPIGLIEIETNTRERTFDAEACGSYISPSGRYIWSSSGVYRDTVTSDSGYIEFLTINLKINTPTAKTIDAMGCHSYTSPSGKYTWAYSGIFKDTIPNGVGCDSVITVDLTIITVDTSVTRDQDVLKANATGATYQWIDCNNGNMPIEGENQQSFAAGKEGNYAVVVTQNACSDTSACIPFHLPTLLDNTFKHNISIYPNPSFGSLTIDLGKVYTNVVATITEMDGRIIQSQNSRQEQLINLKMDVSPGIYLLTITSENERAIFKLVKK